MTSGAHPEPDLLTRIDLCIAAALESGALQPIRTEQTEVVERGLRFAVRWVSSLARKDAARVDEVTRRKPDFNPFLPPDPALTVGPVGEHHLAVLNKYPVIERHLLIVTRAFEAQTSPLTLDDFDALAAVMGPHGGLGFYNGGADAGASQPHKHLQWIPHGRGLAAFTDHLADMEAGEATALGALEWAHLFVKLDAGLWQRPQPGATLREVFAQACRRLGLDPAANPMPPYNLLLTHDHLLLVPRRCEKWQDISVNALGYAGSLFVRRPEQIDELRAVGPLRLLAEVARTGA
ncbi:ATP adenylyltransferase family protein [Azoarcus olearius]|uniref:ATP adenylyltransferase n=1 Tax=Azoarcus sp. (strain BH72) TaxID=418699 RepID=A1K5N9_AZOSB|nr:DUF4922 domain-containing protein [Azoarcus olearius]CAL94144.1 putative ATP adenylyltransferase [Azoarcus olearius]